MDERPKRTTAGILPTRYRDEPEAEAVPPSTARRKENKSQNMSPPSSLPHSSLQVSKSARQGSRGAGRRRKRDEEPQQECDETEIMMKRIKTFVTAAFPTLEHPEGAEGARKGNFQEDQQEKRDSMDLKTMEAGLSAHLPNVKKHFYEGHWFDQEGHILHGLAAYYDNHAEEFEAADNDNQGDSKDKNAAYRQYLETPEAARIIQTVGVKSVAAGFDEWWKGAIAKSMPNSSADSSGFGSNAFRDEEFGTLHFKLQWCMISEIEEDLTRYPPTKLPKLFVGGSHRYARTVLGIRSSMALKEISTKMQEAMNDPESLPKRHDYEKARAYLQRKGLPIALIEIYDYLVN